MAKAAVIVGDCSASNNRVHVSYTVTVDTGLAIGGSATVNFSSSVIQIANDIKNKVRQDVLDAGGPSLSTATDIVVFGGPS